MGVGGGGSMTRPGMLITCNNCIILLKYVYLKPRKIKSRVRVVSKSDERVS